MFDIGPSELVLIFIVALLVIGPEKLPSAIRTGSLWVGRFRRSFHKIKAEVEKELNTDEIKRQLHNESILEEVEKAKSKVDTFTKDIEKVATDIKGSDETDLRLDAKTDTESAGTKTPQSTDEVSQKPKTSDSQKEKGNSIAGELKQAVSYVNDISRDVKNSSQEIEAEFSEPETKKKPKPSEEK
jgi:sec-independent protein translocase protein TatB